MTIITQRTDGLIRSVGIQGPPGPIGSLGELVIPTSSIIGRKTAGTGATEILTASDAKVVLALNNVNNTLDTDKPVSTAAREIFDGLDGNGVIDGMFISINADPTKIDISSGNYHVALSGTVPFAGMTAVALTYLTTNAVTYLALTQAGALVQSITPFTPLDRRTHILLGAAIHSNLSTVNVVNNLPDVAVSGLAQYNDLIDGLKAFNIIGNVFSANGANLFLNKSLGTVFKKGSNYSSSPNAPHDKVLAALVAPSTMRYRLSNSTEYTDTQSISLYYESTPGVRTVLPSARWSIQRITVFTSNLIRIQYGQAIYTTEALALQALHTEAFISEQNIADNGLLRCFLIVKGNCVDLTDTSRALFVEADRFGGVSGGGGSGNTSLQQAYNNSETPEILTDATLGALSIKRGSAADTNSVFEIQNGAGTLTSQILGDGNIVLAKTAGVGLKVDTTLPTYPWKEVVSNSFVKTTGVNAPVLTVFNGSIRSFAFAAGDLADLEFQIPHDYLPGSDLFIYYHWAHNGTVISGDMVATFAYTYSKGYNQALFTAEKTSASTYSTIDIATTPQYRHRIEELQLSSNGGSATLLDSTLIEPTGLILVSLVTTTIPTITGGATKPFIFQIDLHYQSVTVGTKQKNTPFWT